MKRIFFLITFLCISFNYIHSQTILLNSFGPTFSEPVEIKNAGDDRLFVVEKSGIIKILNADGSVNGTPFLDISSIVGSTGSEQGLLGLAFHPNYPTNPNFYVDYTDTAGNTTIANYTVSTDPNIANTSGTIVLTLNQPYANHNGGCINFGPDGYLYIATGDGGNAGDPGNRAQNLNSLFGKMLRIDVDNGTPYAIPPDNPYSNDGDASTLGEIWAYGLRNPWKFSFDSQTNDLWIADVGQDNYEEINTVQSTASGLNFGWRCYEGTHSYNTSGCPGSSTITFPVAEYSHNNSGQFKCSITGGYRYRGTEQTSLQGKYVFADYCSGEIGILSNTGTWNYLLTEPVSGNWTTFGEDANGELYVADITSGSIYKIVENSLSVDGFGLNTINIYPNPSKGFVNFDFTGLDVSNLSIDIFSIQGKLVQHIDSIPQQIFEMSTHNLQNGFYIVAIKNNSGKIHLSKLIVNKP